MVHKFAPNDLYRGRSMVTGTLYYHIVGIGGTIVKIVAVVIGQAMVKMRNQKGITQKN